MNYISKKVLPGFIMLSAILLGACAPSALANSTDAINVIYTAAAQTNEAQYTEDAQSTLDQSATLVPTETAFDMASPTNLPTVIFSLPTSTPYTTTLVGAICDNASYISDVTIPDYSAVDAGQSFVKTWMVQNTGSCTWDANYTLTFVSGDQMNGTDTSIGGSVVPGQQAELSVTMTAPTTAGQYTGYWRLANDSGETFGVTVYVLIDVAEDATATPSFTPEPPTASATEITSTATASLSDTPTDTPQPTATSSPTAEVPTPTSTNTSAPTPTNTSVPSDTPTPTNTLLPTPTSTPGA
jgi:hypothetical protein